MAADLVNNDVRGRVDLQINGSGTMPMEDGRSNSFGYHIGNMNGFLMLAALTDESVRVARNQGVAVDAAAADLLHYVGEKGGSTRQGSPFPSKIFLVPASLRNYKELNRAGGPQASTPRSTGSRRSARRTRRTGPFR